MSCAMAAGMCVLMGLWAAFFLPETKGVEIEAVYRLFTNHWFWKRTLGVGRVERAQKLPYAGTAEGKAAVERISGRLA